MNNRTVIQLLIGGTAVLLAFFSGWMWRASQQTSTLPPLFEESRSSSIGSPSRSGETKSNAAKSRVLIHVAGAVQKPSVVTLKTGARVIDAIRAAGGPKSDGVVNELNLAAPLEDGQQIRVPTRDEVLVQASVSRGAIHQDVDSLTVATGSHEAGDRQSARKALPSQPVNVNTASPIELQTLPGIGPALAQRIIEYRIRHGRFQSLSDLDQVKGLGTKKLEALRRWVRF